MKLEIGKKYICRDGKVTGPLAPVTPTTTGILTDRQRSWYVDSGARLRAVECPEDIVAEYVEPEYVEPLKLEVGKQYVRRDGNITGKLVHSGSLLNAFVCPFTDPATHESYYGTGRWTAGHKDHKDLISEYVKPALTLPLYVNQVCRTRDGRKARVICVDRVAGTVNPAPVVVLVVMAYGYEAIFTISGDGTCGESMVSLVSDWTDETFVITTSQTVTSASEAEACAEALEQLKHASFEMLTVTKH